MKVCDISKIDSPNFDPTPLSPKRVENPVTPELGRSKRSKVQTPKGKDFFGSLTSHGESKFKKVLFQIVFRSDSLYPETEE